MGKRVLPGSVFFWFVGCCVYPVQAGQVKGERGMHSAGHDGFVLSTQSYGP
jgi:hypothetical protein